MKPAFAASFVISCVALALQFTLTRILSVVYWQHLVYGILTVSLLGFAASGAALARIPRLDRLEEETFVRLCLGGFALSSLLAVGAAGALSGDFFALTAKTFGAGNVARLFLSYLFAAAPFFFFGLLILGLFRRHPERSGPLYAGNLLGSAAGVLLYLAAIRPLGALGLLRLGIFLPAALAALSGARRPGRWAAGFGLALVASLFIRLEPDRHKQYWTLMPDREVEHTEWNAISRVDVIRSRRGGSRHILIDGDAQAPLVPPPRVVEARARARWVHPDSPPAGLQTRGDRLGFVFDAPAGGEVGFFVVVKARTDRIVFHLQTAGNRHSLAVKTRPGEWNRLYVGYDAARKMSQAVENFSSVEQMSWDWIEIAGRSRLLVEGIDGARSFAHWDYNLDLMEIYALDPQTKGFERLISHHLHRLTTGRAPITCSSSATAAAPTPSTRPPREPGESPPWRSTPRASIS